MITDFRPDVDTIELNTVFFHGLRGRRALGQRLHDRQRARRPRRTGVIYNEDNGALLFDEDGAGGAAALRFATLDAAST